MSSPHPDPTPHLPRIYQSHPSRPLPHTPTTTARTGVIVVFPSPVTPSDERKMLELQDIRETWDQAYERWLPHLTLLPPFQIPAQSSDQGTHKNENQEDPHPPISDQSIHALLTRICATTNAHTIHLSETGTFPLRGYTNVHLRPSPHEQGKMTGFLALHGALERGVDTLVRSAGERTRNRGERRRDVQATRPPEPVSEVPVAASSDTLPQDSPRGDPSPRRAYTRPMVRGEAVDEARSVTLPTTEITLDHIATDRAAATTEANPGQDMPTSDHPTRPSHRPSPRSSAPRARHHRSFKPHLSIGQARNPRERDRLISLANGILEGDPTGQEPAGIHCRIDSVFFLSKPVGAAGPYQVISVVPLVGEDM